LRIAWKATWGSSEQAWTHMSPPDSAGSSSSPGSGGSGRSAGGRFPASPSPGFSNRLGPKPKVTVRGEEADGLAGVVGRRQFHVVDVADHLAGARFRRRHGPGPHQLPQLLRVFAQQVEGGEVETILCGGADSRLVLAMEGDAAGALAACVGELTPCQEPPAPETHGRGAHAGGCQQAAARDVGGRRQGVLATG
jgi:hypothetical protein